MKETILLQKIGVKRAGHMIGDTYVHLIMKDGSELSQLVRECAYCPNPKRDDADETLAVVTDTFSCLIVREKTDPSKVFIEAKVLDEEIPPKLMHELRIGKMTLKFSKKEKP